MSFRDGNFARREGLESVQEHQVQVFSIVLTRFRIHMTFNVASSFRRSLLSPERIRVFTVPSG